jgi:predicted RND superfamily exporter protein
LGGLDASLRPAEYFAREALFVMNKILQQLSLFFAAIPDALRPFRVPIVVAVFIATAFLAFGATKFQLDTSFDAWLSDDDPAVQALDEYRRQFGSDDGLFLVYRARDGDVFSPASLSAVRALTDALENWQDISPDDIGVDAEVFQSLDHITRVQSLANTRYQISSDDTLESRLLLPASGEITEDMAQQVRAIAHAQRNLKLLMFSDNGEFGAILLSTDFGTIPVQDASAQTDGDDYSADELDLALESFEVEIDESAIVQEVEFEDTLPKVYIEFIEALKGVYLQDAYASAFEFFPIGTAGMIDFAMQTMKQSGLLVLVAIFIIVLLLYTLFNTASAVLWPVLTVVSSCIWVFGGMAWLGIASTQLIGLTVMLVLAVGIADCVHVMSEYLFFKREGQTHQQAIRKSFEKTGVPILLTSITTMAGMLAIAFGGVGQFVTFGLSSAVGVFAAFLFTIFVLPVLLDFWHPHAPTSEPEKPAQWRRALALILSPLRAIRWVSRRAGLSWLLGATWLQPMLDRVPAFSYRARYPIVAVFIGVFVICAYGATQVRIDTNLVELFQKGTPLRTAYDIVDEHMAGTGNMEIMLDFGRSDAFADARVLKAVDGLQAELQARYGDYVVRTHSLVNLVKATNQAMNDDDPAFYRIPDSSLAVSQLLFLFNSSNPKDRRAIVSDDYSRSHVTIQLRSAGSYEYAIIFADIEAVIDASFQGLTTAYPDWKVELTGTFALMMQMSDVISKSQVRSLTLAAIIISLILTLTLGSIQGGLLAIVPNMLPAILAFGLMGLLGIPLDTDTLMIAPLIIGIAVDDTIHFVTHYRMALARGRTATESLIQTVKEVGQAVTFTTLVLGTAFLMLGFSDYLGLAKVGVFGSLAIFVALLCDLLFLPALIYIFQPKFGVKNVGIAHYQTERAAE